MAPVVYNSGVSSGRNLRLATESTHLLLPIDLTMKSSLSAIVLLGAAVFSGAALGKDLVESNKLRRVLYRSKLLEGANLLQSWAFTTPERNRGFGGTGMFWKFSVEIIYDIKLTFASTQADCGLFV